MNIFGTSIFVHVSGYFLWRITQVENLLVRTFQKYQMQVLLFLAICEDVRCSPARFTRHDCYQEKETLLIGWARRVLILISGCISFISSMAQQIL